MDGLRELLIRKARAVWRRRWIALATAWILCLGGWYEVMEIPNQYEANARLYVDADAVLTPLLRGLSLDNSVSGELDVLQRTLLSRPNLEKLIAKTDLELNVTGPADLERMVARLGTEIRVVPQTRNLFTITYRNTSPKTALDVVQGILTTFIESKIGNNRSDMENAQVFLQAQIDNYERQLRDAERKRAEFRTKYIDLLPADGGGVSRYEAAQASVRQLQGSLEDTMARRASLAKELLTTPPLVVTETDPGSSGGGGGPSVNPRIAEAERQLDEMRLRYTDNYPDVIAQRQLIEALRSGKIGAPTPSTAPRTAATAARTRSVPNPVYEQLKIRMVENDAVISSVQRQITEAQKERNRLEEIARGAPQLQADFINLNRDYDVIRRNYDELLGRREQMRIAAAADADANKVKIQIVDPPQKPQTPVAPRRGVLLSAVLGAGLAAGAALSLMLGEIDASFQNIDDLRVLGLPVIGGISVIMSVVPRWRVFLAIGSFAVVLLALCGVYGGLVMRLAAAGVA
jgi:polysaccharide chain length determinant protein (PEP-CTERM system associated)